MLFRTRFGYVRPAVAVHLSTLLSIFVCLLVIASPLSAQVTSTPGDAIFSAPGTIGTFSITVPSGTTLGGISVLTLGAPNLDFLLTSGTTCPTVTAGTCTIMVQFEPTAPGRRQGMIVLTDPSGNTLATVSLDGTGPGALAAFGPGTISTSVDTSTQLATPTGVALDGFGNLYIAYQNGNQVLKVTPAGIVSVFAGNGTPGYGGDGNPATSAQLNGPMAVLVDGAGEVFIADTGNNVIRMVNQAGIISTYAGQYYLTGTTPPPVCATATDPVGDGCPATQIVLNTPVDLAMCHVQNLHIADKLNNRIRTVIRLQSSPLTMTQVGTGTAGYNGDGEGNTSAELNGPTGIDMDAANNIYVADSGNHIIRKTLLTGTTPNPIFTVAGTPGTAGYLGDGGVATSAELNSPRGVKVDPAGDIYISDYGSHVIRAVNAASGIISTIAGTGTAGYSGDSDPATSAQLNAPSGIVLDRNGNLYVADSQNFVVRKVDVSDAPSLSFANTPVGGASASRDVTVLNMGNTALVISGISTAANFSLGGSDTSCNSSSGQTLNPAASCVLGIEFTPTGVGSVSGSVVLTDNANSTSSQTIALSGTASALTQTITFPNPGPQVYGAAPIMLTASASSKLPVSYAVTSGPATLNGSTLTITGAGSVTVQASQSGNATYSAAIPVSVTFTVSELTQTITFPNPGTQVYGAAPIVLTASASSKLPVSYAVTSGPATVNGSKLTITGAGSVTLQASQTGNATYSAAIPVSVTFTVNQEVEAYTLTANAPTVSMTAGSSGTATLTLNSSSYAGTVSFVTSVSSTAGTAANVTASASSVTLTPGGTGTCTVTITANANAANHTPSAPWKSSGTLMFCAVLLGAPFALRRRRTIAVLLSALSISLAGFLIACGAGSSPTKTTTQTPTQTAARTYIVTVTPTASAAASVTVTNPVPVSITVTVP